MAKELPNEGHNIRADSYFGCYSSAVGLDEMHHNFNMACRGDRPFAVFARYLHPLVTGTDSPRKLVVELGTPVIALTVEQQKKTGPRKVNFLSNLFAGDEEVETQDEMKKLDINDDYDQHMGYVDQADCNAREGRYPHKHLKWTHAIFFWLLKVSISNAWLIWRHKRRRSEEDEPLDVFTEELVREMKNEGLNLVPEPILCCLPKTLNCSLCYHNTGKKSRTVFFCGHCDRAMHEQCFHQHEMKVKRKENPTPITQQNKRAKKNEAIKLQKEQEKLLRKQKRIQKRLKQIQQKKEELEKEEKNNDVPSAPQATEPKEDKMALSFLLQ